MRPILAVTALALIGACTTERASLGPSGRVSADGAPDDALTYSDWSPPVNLGPVINTAASEQHPAISRDGLSLYFVSDRAGGVGGLDIYVSQRTAVGEPWGPPENLGPTINSAMTDMAPDLSIDGHRLFFHSGPRADGCGGFDLYVATRSDVHDDFAWGAPDNLGCTINSPANDAGPTYTTEPDGPTLYFTSTRPGGPGDFDIYKSVLQEDGSWGVAVLVPELSGPARDTRTAISRTGLELFISSDVAGRPGGVGGQDVWVSTRDSDGDPWTAPANLGPTVNTAAFDGAPALSFDGTTLYFYSNRPGGSGNNDLYCTTRTPPGQGRPAPQC
jgi:WD40-like Beta Propeller Repeat